MSKEPDRAPDQSLDQSLDPAADKPSDAKTAVAERREARRYAFICPAELIDLAGSTRISARTADLSLRGCYIDTLNPFPPGTRVRLQLTKNGQRVEFRAKVTSCHMGSGMGLIFERLTPAQMDTVVSWLEGTSSPAEASFRAAASSSVKQGTSEPNARFAAKLLKLLERKGIITRSEAADLLRDLDS
jgi:PilZ domain-containing protein